MSPLRGSFNSSSSLGNKHVTPPGFIYFWAALVSQNISRFGGGFCFASAVLQTCHPFGVYLFLAALVSQNISRFGRGFCFTSAVLQTCHPFGVDFVIRASVNGCLFFAPAEKEDNK
jgi:hypothetical protein